MAKHAITNAVIVSDIHAGCQYAVCPERVKLDGGGVYRANKYQRHLLSYWHYFWNEWVPRATRDEPFVVVINGDCMDGVHHRSTTQITHNGADQHKIAYELLAPIRDRAEQMILVRGTEAHVGPSAENEERLGEALGTVKNIDGAGNHSCYELWMTVGGSLMHATHHIGATGSMSYEATAPMKEMTELFANTAADDARIPDVIVRSHRHRHIEVRRPTYRIYGIVFTTACWQARTPYGYKIPGGRVSTPQIGGSLVRQGDEELYTRHCVESLPRSRVHRPVFEG